MKHYTLSAPAKFILFGEHAVVFGHPAIAMPVLDLRAHVNLIIDDTIDDPFIDAHDLGCQAYINRADPPLAVRHMIEAIRLVPKLGGFLLPQKGWSLSIESDIPIGRGLGSSAAISVALIKAMYTLSHTSLTTEILIYLSYELEKYHHGTPSGVDNTVISIEKPVLYQRGKDIMPLDSELFYFVIGDTGISKSTAKIVAEVAERFNLHTHEYSTIFQAIGNISATGYDCLKSGDHHRLGDLMNRNHLLLRQIGVSADELEHLIAVALNHGALGAKLCGAGKGGCMVCVAEDESAAHRISDALLLNGAVNCYVSRTLVRS
ncbi:mevalonate kinase [candidate division KSB1 bacterium]|nr:mevalonate kinase [candidate division KSB1 bacterium]